MMEKSESALLRDLGRLQNLGNLSRFQLGRQGSEAGLTSEGSQVLIVHLKGLRPKENM